MSVLIELLRPSRDMDPSVGTGLRTRIDPLRQRSPTSDRPRSRQLFSGTTVKMWRINATKERDTTVMKTGVFEIY